MLFNEGSCCSFPLCLGPLVARRARACAPILPSLFLPSRLPPRWNHRINSAKTPKLFCPVPLVAATVRKMEIDQFVFETNNTYGYLVWVGLGLERLWGGGVSVFTLRYKQEKINSTITHRTGLTLEERISPTRPNTPVFLQSSLIKNKNLIAMDHSKFETAHNWFTIMELIDTSS